MQLKYIALIATTSLVFAGCSLLPGQDAQAPDSEGVMEETYVEDTMMKDQELIDGEAMMEGEETVTEDETMTEDDKMMDDDSAMDSGAL